MLSYADDLAMMLDPALLFKRAWASEPDEWQADLLRSGASQIILDIHRQGGKSTASSIMALHDALYAAPALDLVLSPSLRQSAELFEKIKAAYYEVIGVKPKQDSAVSLKLNNGSRVVCLPGSEATVRGFSSVSRLIIDEASRCEDALYMSVRPMLSISMGKIALLSTPFGRRGFYSKEWHEGSNWYRVKVTSDQCPRIDPAWLAQERKNIGDFWFRQEHMGEFLEEVGSVFTFDEVENALDDSIPAVIL